MALFNLDQQPQTIDFKFDLVPGLEGPNIIRDLWKNEDIGSAKDHFSTTIGPHGAGLSKLTEAY